MAPSSAQYNNGPSSLPNDYSIISQYASHHDDHALDSGDEELMDNEDNEENNTESIIRRLGSALGNGSPGLHPSYGTASSPTRRLRISHSHESIHGRRSSFGGYSVGQPQWKVSDQEPLLGIPRIEEDCDANSAEEPDPWQLWIQEAKVIARYTAPVFGTHLLEYSLSMVSVISIGHLGVTQLAAATLGSMTSSVTGLSIILGFVSALDSLLPQAWTSNPTLVGLWSQRMVVLLFFLLFPIFLIWFSAEPILLGLRQEPEVAHLAGVYLRWLSMGLPAYAFNAVARRYFQSQGLMHVPTAIVVIVAPINILLNWLFVWGPPAVRLGYIGAPIATALSFNLIGICTLIYGIFYAPRTAWRPVSIACFKSLGVLTQLGLASVGQLAAEWWSWELVGLAASLLGPVSLASQSVLLVSASTSYQAPYALSVAAAVRIGNNLGSGHASRAKAATSVSLIMALALGLFFGLIFTTFRSKWAYIFNDDPDVVALVAGILPLVGLFQVFDGTCAVTAGVLRSRGRQSLGALLNFSAYYIIGIPLGLILSFKFGMELYGLWIGLAVALFYGAGLTVWIVLRTDWDHEIERVAQRLAADTAYDRREDGNGHLPGRLNGNGDAHKVQQETV